MEIVRQAVNIAHISHPRPLAFIEDTARICYKSHDRTKPGSDQRMVDNLIKNKHLAMLEFVDVVVDFFTNRAVTHELVRHRLCSFAQESQRYVVYDSSGIKIIAPVGYDPKDPIWRIWKTSMYEAEQRYLEMMAYGATPQQARNVLPNSTATVIRMKANLREWMHVMSLRDSAAADPQMKEIAGELNKELKVGIPGIFDR